MLTRERWKQINQEMALLSGISLMEHRVQQVYRASQRTKHPGSKRQNTPLRKTNRREYKRRRAACRRK